MERDQKHSCQTCGKWTTEGLRALQISSRSHPIFLKPDDFKRPISEIIEQLRMELVSVRGKISDIRSAGYWDESLNEVEGLLTCGISYLYYVKGEMLDHKHKYPDTSAC